MFTMSSPSEMQAMAIKWRNSGKKIIFVPTMGALHEGHLTLMREGRRLGDVLVVSVFVNPLQFGPSEDLNKYPRDLEGDLEKIKSCGADAVFYPSINDMYATDHQTYVEVLELSKWLCGKSRPTHFRGVTTVVLKLFNIVQPNIVILGEKDYQQLVIIKKMVADLDVPVEVVGVPIVREKDGIAMSSRNIYLSVEERKAASSLSQSLKMAQDLIKNGERNISKIEEMVRKQIESTKIPRVDYVEICDANTLERLSELNRPARLIIAAFVGKARLIDNCKLL